AQKFATPLPPDAPVPRTKNSATAAAPPVAQTPPPPAPPPPAFSTRAATTQTSRAIARETFFRHLADFIGGLQRKHGYSVGTNQSLTQARPFPQANRRFHATIRGCSAAGFFIKDPHLNIRQIHDDSRLLALPHPLVRGSLCGQVYPRGSEHRS